MKFSLAHTKLGSKICTYQSDICHPCIQRGKCTWSFGSFLGEYRCHYSRKVPPHRDLYLYQIKQSFAIKTNYIYITFKQAVHAVISILYINSEKNCRLSSNIDFKIISLFNLYKIVYWISCLFLLMIIYEAEKCILTHICLSKKINVIRYK